MGKSLKNSVSPDEIYATYGADTLRLYEMAMGPLDADRPWHTDDIVGVVPVPAAAVAQPDRRAPGRAQGGRRGRWTPAPPAGCTRRSWPSAPTSAELRFNTAIARLHELNSLRRQGLVPRGRLPRGLAEPLVLMVAPLAPHIAEELWSTAGPRRDGSSDAAFPEADESLAAEPAIVIPVQVNGKTRFQVEVPAGAGEDEIEAIVTAHPRYAQFTADTPVPRLIIVPGRIANIVTQ